MALHPSGNKEDEGEKLECFSHPVYCIYFRGSWLKLGKIKTRQILIIISLFASSRSMNQGETAHVLIHVRGCMVTELYHKANIINDNFERAPSALNFFFDICLSA